MPVKEFGYDTSRVMQDIIGYLQSRDDVYGTTTTECYPGIIEDLIQDVSSAIHDPKFRAYLLERRLPDRVRILLDGVGLLEQREIERRWDMLKTIYRNAEELSLPIGTIGCPGLD